MSNLEKLLNIWSEGGDISSYTPQSEIEFWLKNIALGEGNENTPAKSRATKLLKQIALGGGAGGGGGIPEGYIKPEGTLDITENGTYDVSTYANANVNVASSGSGGGEVGDGYKIRYIDADGTILKTEYVEEGGKLTPPSNPTYDSEYLEFDGWNYDVDNYIVNRNTDVGAIYRTKTGDTYLFIRLTENIGLEIPTMSISGATSIDWGDGTVDTNLTHTYADYGDYVIKISGMTQITTYLFGASNIVVYCLQKCYLGNNVTSIGDFVFRNCQSLTNINIPKSVTSIGMGAFQGCYPLTNVTIPESVTSIGIGTFSSCYSLTNINIPESVTSIGPAAFQESYSLTSINIPDGITSIGLQTFSSCYSLTSINVPSSVTSIGQNAFNNCTNLENITIPNSVTSIGEHAFTNCYLIQNYVFNCTSVPTLSGTSVFTNINQVATIIWVKDELVENYKSATNWSTYATYIKPISAMPQKLKEELGL